MSHGINAGGTVYAVKGGKTVVDGSAYSVSKGRTLVAGTGYDISFVNGIPAGDLAVGTSIYANVDGVKTEFIVVHQGNPSTSIYDSSCDGTWVVMKHLAEDSHMTWRNSGSSSISYSLSNVDKFLTNTFLPSLDENVQNAIKTVKIPYITTSGVAKGSSGLSKKVFAMSLNELGLTSNAEESLVAGAKLSYFRSSTLRKATTSGGYAYGYWLRTPCSLTSSSADAIKDTGAQGNGIRTSSYYRVRPTFILDKNTIINPDDYTIIC